MGVSDNIGLVGGEVVADWESNNIYVCVCFQGSVCQLPVQGLDSVRIAAEVTLEGKINRKEVTVNPIASSLIVISEGKAFSIANIEDRRSVLAVLPRVRKNTVVVRSSCYQFWIE